MTDMFISVMEPLLVKKAAYRFYGISELISQPEKLRMLFIGRKGQWRQILNEKEMIGNITEKCKDIVEFQKTYFDRKSHHDQILSMRNTDILLGYHGAAFVNIMFMMPYSGFIELFSPISRPRYYDMMAIKTQLIYRSLTRNKFDRTQKLPRDGRNINIFVDIEKVVGYVRELALLVQREKYKNVTIYL